MAKLIQKSGYIQTGGTATGYMEYIATRENVEKLHGNGPATANQKRLIAELLRDFPDAKKLFEYEDYTATPTFSNASAFITMALDSNAHAIQDTDGYMKYIATRPRVERQGEHGLFSDSDSVSLPSAIEELKGHDGRVWTFIYSLRREDAARLGYDSAVQWRKLILSQKQKIAKTMQIPTSSFRWYAAFHDEGHHPHIHMMVWSDAPKQEGYLNPNGIAAMRSALTNEIFKDELYALYKEKDISYKEVTEKAQRVMRELITQMESNLCDSPAIAQMMAELTQGLEVTTGKKVYGYLKKPLKEKVDVIVDELAKLQPVADCYAVWNELRDKLESYYKTKPREHLPLSQQKEFRSIKNMVIREAENIRLGVYTFEDEDMQDEPEENRSDDGGNSKQKYKLAAEYQSAKAILADNTLTWEEKQAAVDTLEQLWHDGFTAAAHQLGKVWRDGLCDPPDEKQAEKWFRLAADAGLDYSQYALGKLLQEQGQITKAVSWYEKAATQGNCYANYRLGKLYLTGDDVSKDVERAIEYLTASADRNNKYAQYTLGKLYLMGRDIPRDEDVAHKWLTASAAQGNPYAQFFLERMGQFRDPSILLTVTRLLHHLANTFRDNAQPPANPAGLRIDSKRRRKLMQKRLAMGHKANDHEEQTLS